MQIGLQKVSALNVATMTDSKLASDPVCLLLVPNDTPQKKATSAGDAIGLRDI